MINYELSSWGRGIFMTQGSNNDFVKTDEFSKVTLEFEPRGQLHDFINDRNTIYWLENQPKYNSLSENMIIKGDNLAAMAALRVSWLLSGDEKKFDLIYIDPPYNVGGNTGYKNKWKGESEGNYGWAGDHGKFLDFMEPRLRMSKLLMKDEGIIFVSICDAEYPRLMLLMEEIFGPNNLVGTFIWDKKQGSPSSSINVIHEYVICFAKNKYKSWKLEQLKPGHNELINYANKLTKKYDLEIASKKLKTWINTQIKKGIMVEGLANYNLIHPITKRVFRIDNTCAQDDNDSRYKEPLLHPVTQKTCPVPSKGWKWKKDTLLNEMVDYENVVNHPRGYICGKIFFGLDDSTIPQKVVYLDEKEKQKPPSIIRTKSSGARDLPLGVVFDTPKPVELIEILIGFIPSNNIRILDFFAGSGTTSHAVCNLNLNDKGSRSYVMIEEMNRTIQNAILPRMEYLSHSNTFGLYSLVKKQAGSVDLLKAFRKHAEEFVRFLHSVGQYSDLLTEGIKIIGYSSHTGTLVATLSQELRNSNSSYFRAELSCLAKAINNYGATRVIVYRLESEFNDEEEPWVGIKKDIFIGTSCNKFDFLSLPSELIRVWHETLIALEAV